MDTFEAYRTKDGIRVWRAYIAFGDGTPIAAAVKPIHCQSAYGDVVYGSPGNANVYRFELSGTNKGDFICPNAVRGRRAGAANKRESTAEKGACMRLIICLLLILLPAIASAECICTA
jgi:hypothetical protein